MILYLINFVLCSGLLLLVYRLFLQHERMYRFNRFYLLFSLAFALVVPLISITANNEMLPLNYQQVITRTFNNTTVETQPLSGTTPITAPVTLHNYWLLTLISLYGVVAAILMLRFLVNLYRINHTLNNNKMVKYQHTRLILTNQNVTPHSFLTYVFVNSDDYYNGKVEPEIICHEQTHVNQLHSLDVLLVELLQIVFWFNPFLPFYRQVIQLNHEFLADEAVVNNYQDTPTYQYLLVNKAGQNHSLQLTSQFNYQTIKKRLIMMSKKTSAKRALGKQLILILMAAIAIILFSKKTEAGILPNLIAPFKINKLIAGSPVTDNVSTPDTLHKKKPFFVMRSDMRLKHAAADAPQNIITAYEEIIKKYDIPNGFERPNGKGKTKNISVEDKAKMHGLFVQMSEYQQDTLYIRFTKAFKPIPKNTVTAAQIQRWQGANDYGVWINDKRIRNTELGNYKPEDFDLLMYSRLTPVAIKNDGFSFQVNLMTKAYYADYYKKTMANQEDRMDHIHVMGKQLGINVKESIK